MQRTRRIRGQMNIVYRVNNANHFGIGLYDALPTAWELIPYSFVVDWFIGVGDWIQACMPNPHVSHLASSATVCEEEVVRLELLGNMSSWPGRLHGAGLNITRSSLDELRRINPNLPSHPVVNREWMSLKREIDSFALPWQILSSKVSGGLKRGLRI